MTDDTTATRPDAMIGTTFSDPVVAVRVAHPLAGPWQIVGLIRHGRAGEVLGHAHGCMKRKSVGLRPAFPSIAGAPDR